MNVATSTGCAYAVHDGNEIDARAAAIAAWRGTLGPDDELDARFDALAVHATFGPPLLRHVYHRPEARYVGVVGISPRRMVAHGCEVRAGVLSHLAIDPGHRSLGPALMMLESLLDEASRRFDVVYGIPANSAGADAVLQRVGLKTMGHMVRSVKVLRHAHYLARTMPRAVAAVAGRLLDLRERLREWPRRLALSSRWCGADDADIRAVWDASGPGAQLAMPRDAPTLRWRFVHAPGPPVRFLAVKERRGGRVHGWVACSPDLHAPHILEVRDAWCVHGGAVPTAAMLAALISRVRTEGYAGLSVQMCTDDAAAAPWRSAGFVERSRQAVFSRWFDRGGSAASVPAMHLTSVDQDG